MKARSIKRYLRKHSIFGGRKTTIAGAFASAIAPVEKYDLNKLTEALSLLGQDVQGELLCVYCDSEAKTWDHLTNLVKGGKFQGFGHQVGNLVPCCKTCNEKKQGKPYREFVLHSISNPIKAEEKVKQLEAYQSRFACNIDIGSLDAELQGELEQLDKIKEQIFALMKDADMRSEKIAAKLSLFSKAEDVVSSNPTLMREEIVGISQNVTSTLEKQLLSRAANPQL